MKNLINKTEVKELQQNYIASKALYETTQEKNEIELNMWLKRNNLEEDTWFNLPKEELNKMGLEAINAECAKEHDIRILLRKAEDMIIDFTCKIYPPMADVKERLKTVIADRNRCIDLLMRLEA